MTSPSREVRDDLTAGRELDALVAEKVFGAVKFRAIDVVNGKRDETFAEFPGDPIHALRRVPYYSTDIAAAWEVVELLERDERRILSEITRRQSTFGTHFIYAVVLRQCTAPFPPHWWSEEVTAPLAICVAALKAVAP